MDISFNLKGSDLNEGNNTINLQAKYKDRVGRIYSVERGMIIELEKVSFLQKIVIVLKGINMVIERIFT